MQLPGISAPFGERPPPALLDRGLDRLLGTLPTALRVLIPLVLVLAPLLLEGIPTLPALAVEVLLALCVGLWWICRAAAPLPAPLEVSSLLLPLLGIAAWTALQLIPLPVGLARLLSAGLAGHLAQTYSLLPTDQMPEWLMLSQHPAETMHALARLLLVTGFFVVVRDLARTREERLRLVVVLLLAGSVQVGAGLLHSWLSEAIIYLQTEALPEQGPALGIFLSRNRNATYLNLLWPLGLSLALGPYFRPRARRSRRSSRVRSDLPQGGAEAEPEAPAASRAARPERHGRTEDSSVGDSTKGLALALSLLLLGAMILCRSRGAWGAASLALVTLLLVLVARRGHGRLAAGLAAAGLVGLPLLTVLFWKPLLELLSGWAGKSTVLLRPQLWASGWEMARDHLLCGVGLGAFPDAFGRYTPLTQYQRALSSENVYLDILGELGVPGALLSLAVVVGFVRILVRSQIWQARRELVGVPGMLAALAGLAFHANFDLVLRGYGTLITATALGALMTAAALDRGGVAFDPHFRFGPIPWRVLGGPLLISLTLLPVGSVALGSHAGEVAAKALADRRLEGERELLERAAWLSPLSPEPLLWQGLLALNALTDLTRGLEQARQDRIEILELSDLDEEAERFFARSLARAPGAGTSQRLLTRLALQRGEEARALALAEDACRVQPNDYRNWMELGRAARLPEQRVRRLDALKRGLELVPDKAAEGVARETLFLLRADSAGRKAVFSRRAPSTVLYAFAAALSEGGRKQEAIPWLEALVEQPPQEHSVLVGAAWLAVRAGALEQAERFASVLEARAPETGDAMVILAEVRSAQGRVDDAIEAWDRAGARVRRPELPQLRAIRILAEQGRIGEARERAARVRDRHPANLEVRLAEARLYHETAEDRLKAADLLRESARIAPQNEAPLVQLWQLHRLMEAPMLALQDLERCLSLELNPRCRAAAGEMALEAGEWESARMHLERSVAQDADSGDAWAMLAEAALRAGDRARAIDALQEAEGRSEGASPVRLERVREVLSKSRSQDNAD